MQRRQRLVLSALALGLVPISGAVGTPAWADPPATATGMIVIDPLSFRFTTEEPTGPVERFSFSFNTTVSGDFTGTTSESFDCLQAGGAVRCLGTGTSVGTDGSTGSIRAILTCTPLPELVCEGKGQFRGSTPDGERLIWMSDISPAGPFTATYVSRVVHGPS